MKLLLLFILLTSIFLNCRSENQRESYSEVTHATSETPSCSFNPLDGECTYYSDKSVLCSMGKCSSGDCSTGKGVLTYPSGTTLETNFKNGEIDKVISLKECGSSLHFVGILGNNSSKGVHTYTNGEVFDGLIANGMKQGKGIFTDSKGNSYEGNWKNDIREGKFTIKDKESGKKRIVSYINGKDDEERERERLYAIEQKRKTEERIAEMRRNASINLAWHKKFLACNVFTFDSPCDANVTIIYKDSNSVNTKICGKNFKIEDIFFQCQIKGWQRGAIMNHFSKVFIDENGNCSTDINDLCD